MNKFHDHGCVREHAAMTGSRRQAAGAVARDRALLVARDVAILKAVGMSPRQLLAMVMTASAVLGVMGLALALAAAVPLPVEPPAAGPP